ncbi:MAG: fabF, partial [Verrucomicrobiales bacterium]|nr:fabF [Verrucomicrobiales bacterium]
MTTSSRLTALLRDDPVVVTGRGVVAATGFGVENLWEAVAARRSPARWMEMPKTSGGTRRVAAFPVAALEWAGHPWGRMARRLDLGGQYGMAAAFEAVREADFAGAPPVSERLGVIMGSSRGPKGKWVEGQDLLRAGKRMKPTLAATTTLAASAGGICQVLSALGPGWLVSTACASGAYAIAQAAEQILLGHADVMIAGGADDTFQELIYAGLEAAGVLAVGGGAAAAADLCRPFARDRNGLVPGSGAGVLVLES